ncbi:MAG TPA: ABC transporter permease [Thermodesulfobacteriota bacterium]
MKYIPFLLKNVFRKKTRSVLTIISILIPLILICLLNSFLQVLDQPDPSETRGMFRLVTRHKVGITNPIPASYADKISRLDGVMAITNFAWFGGTYIDESSENFFARFAVEPKSLLNVFDDASMVKGSTEDWINDASGCIVGEDLVEKFGWKIGDKIVIVGTIYPVTLQLTVRGVYKVATGASDALFFNRKYLEEALPSFKGRAGTIWTKAGDAESATRLATQIDKLFENSAYPTKTESEKAFQMGFVSMLGNVKLLITTIGVIIVLVVILISANTIAISARERIREIAVLRTMGFTRIMILSFILGESLVMSAIGGILGVVIFVLTFDPLKSFLATTPMGGLAKGLAFYPETILLAIIVSMMVGIFSAIIPAIGSSRRSIREGLRYIG